MPRCYQKPSSIKLWKYPTKSPNAILAPSPIQTEKPDLVTCWLSRWAFCRSEPINRPSGDGGEWTFSKSHLIFNYLQCFKVCRSQMRHDFHGAKIHSFHYIDWFFPQKSINPLSNRHLSEELGIQKIPIRLPMGSNTVSTPFRSSQQDAHVHFCRTHSHHQRVVFRSPVLNSDGIYSCSAASPSVPTGHGEDGWRVERHWEIFMLIWIIIFCRI